MTREETKEMLPIMKAFVEGKTIEYSADGKFWSKVDTPTWSSGKPIARKRCGISEDS